MKVRIILFILFASILTFLGCESDQSQNIKVESDQSQNLEADSDKSENTEVDSNVESYTPTDSTGFDWSIDPLEVKLSDEDLIVLMNKQDLDTVKAHLYNYFHLQQTGDSTDYVKHFDYYPSMFDGDSMVYAYADATIKWWNMGYRNIFETIDINYVSDWVLEEDQKVAIIGFDLKFRTEFSHKYPSDPKRLIETLQRQMPKAELIYLDEEPIKSIVAYDTKGIFVSTPLDRYDFTFLNEDEGRNNHMDTLMLRDTRLLLLRNKREAIK